MPDYNYVPANHVKRVHALRKARWAGGHTSKGVIEAGRLLGDLEALLGATAQSSRRLPNKPLFAKIRELSKGSPPAQHALTHHGDHAAIKSPDRVFRSSTGQAQKE